MRIAIHQPNYVPWAGYFHKIARSDVFVFLDDAQYPKNSYVNRVKIRAGRDSAWLTIPAKPKLGTAIRNVVPSQDDWPKRHADRLRNEYGRSAFFSDIWEVLEPVYQALPSDSLDRANRMLIQRIAEKLELESKTVLASEIPNSQGFKSDDRLVDLVRALDGAVYLSGRGGSSYQDPAKFADAGIVLETTHFQPTPYDQGVPDFLPGLSILDCLFHMGWDATAHYIRAVEEPGISPAP